MTCSLLALNVATPTAERAKELLGWLWHEGEDAQIWVLTETSAGPGSRLIAQVCRAAGFQVLLTSPAEGGGRGVMVVVRDAALAVSVEEGDRPEVLPGRVLPLRVVLPGESGVLRLLGVYGAASDPVRYSSSAQRRRKREWIAAFDAWLRGWRAVDPGSPGVVIGDLNLVDPQHDDELAYVLAQETALLERLVGEPPDGHGLLDAYRLSQPAAREVSWVDHSGVGCRYDHAFVTPDLAPAVAACSLDHAPRLAGLTDHSALRLTFDL